MHMSANSKGLLADPHPGRRHATLIVCDRRGHVAAFGMRKLTWLGGAHGGRFNSLFVMHAGCLLETFPAERSLLKKPIVEFDRNGFGVFLAPCAGGFFVIRADDGFHLLALASQGVRCLH